jgi:rare lipoprotein A
MNELTAAHRDIPFGTRLRVTCPENGLSVLVRINDRGPFIEGRDLDLSLAAARSLGIEEQGLAWVRMEAVVN